MTTSHTPGPWYTGEPFAAFEGGTLRFHISQAEGAPYTPHYSDVAQLVAETIPGERLEIQRANARLIAAAPELLEQLKDSLDALARVQDDPFNIDLDAVSMAIHLTKQVITKATGEAQ